MAEQLPVLAGQMQRRRFQSRDQRVGATLLGARYRGALRRPWLPAITAGKTSSRLGSKKSWGTPPSYPHPATPTPPLPTGQSWNPSNTIQRNRPRWFQMSSALPKFVREFFPQLS
jgi:hypothetical protein